MKYLVLLLVLIGMIVILPAHAQKPINCNFGDDSTSLDDIFQKDIAVMTFLNKYPDALRSVIIHTQDPLQGELSFTVDKNNKEVLLLKFNQNENGCYRPYVYHYTFNNGIIDVTVKNSILNFTEIINLIKSDDKRIEDFYTKNCNEIQLDVVLGGNSKPYFCKSDVDGSVEMYLQKHVGGIIEIRIPDKVMDALFYNCAPNQGFFVLNSGEEIGYDFIAKNNMTVFKIDAPSGYNKIEIFQSYNIGALGGFCGSIWSADSRYISPLLQTKIGVDSLKVKCNDNLVLTQRKNSEKSTCVTPFTKIEMIIRGLVDDDRLLLGCVGERVQKCYPDNVQEYRQALYHYYFESNESLPTYLDLNISKLHTYNACGDTPVCIGKFDNGTSVRVQCDYPIHGCLVPFDKNTFQD